MSYGPYNTWHRKIRSTSQKRKQEEKQTDKTGLDINILQQWKAFRTHLYITQQTKQGNIKWLKYTYIVIRSIYQLPGGKTKQNKTEDKTMG